MKLAGQAHAAQAEADALAGALPAVLLDARRLAAASPGVHGRRRAGPGEAFWQFRDHRPEDGARAVDWRRSARGDRLFVREREMEAAQTCVFWIDPDAGFHWSADKTRPSKARRALTLALAFAMLTVRAGERVGALGGPHPRAGPRAIERLARDLAQPPSDPPPAPPARAAALFFSDFMAPIETWGQRLSAASRAGAAGALVMVLDPAEEDFPFAGRVRFKRPGGGGSSVLLGHAEAARDEYRARLAAQKTAMRQLAGRMGFLFLTHRTDHSAAPILNLIAAGMEPRR